MPPTVEFTYRSQQIKLALMDGCSVSNHIRTAETFYELDYLEALGDWLPDETIVVDVGAHLGNHTIFFSQVLGLRVIAFEPHPETFARLVENVRLAGVEELVTLHNLALSDTDGEAELFMTSNADVGTSSIQADGDNEQHTIATTTTARIDTFVDIISESGVPIFMKIDVEGHEVAVLNGGEQLLALPQLVGLSVECIEAVTYERCRSVLGSSFRPIALMSPTPTVVLERADPESETDSVGSIDDIVTYGIRAAATANRVSSNAHVLAARLERASAEAAWNHSQMRAAMHGLRRGGSNAGIGSAGVDHLPFDAPRREVTSRVVLVSLVDPGAGQDFIALLVDQLDVLHIELASGKATLRYSGFRGGVCVVERTSTLARFDVSLVAATALSMLRLLDEHGADSTVVIVNAPDVQSELAETICGALRCRYVLIFDQLAYNGSILRLETGAESCFVSSTEAREVWSLMHIVDARVIDPSRPEEVVAVVADLEAADADHGTDGSGSSDGHKVLIVSYFAWPTTPVSIQRLSYWHEHMAGAAQERGVDMEVTWLSATASAAQLPGNRLVRDRGDRLVSRAAREQLDEMEALGVPTIGVSWADYVREEAPTWKETYDTVIISCGPFGYLELGGFFKQLWDCQVILDFRDPYAGDPRMNLKPEKREWMTAHEARTVADVDLLVSVNQNCLDVIAPDLQVARAAIPNGFDERVIDPAFAKRSSSDRPEIPIRLLYSGTIYRNWGMEALVDSLTPTRHRLVHIGRDQSTTHSLARHSLCESLGFISDKVEMARILCDADAGIVRTGGEATVATTKVFDYLGCDLDVIIVTDGRTHDGALHDLTKDLPGVHWVTSRPDDLSQFFADYVPARVQRAERSHFSRHHRMNELLDSILVTTDRERSLTR